MIKGIKELHRASEIAIRSGIEEMKAAAGREGYSSEVISALGSVLKPWGEPDFSGIIDPLVAPFNKIVKGLENGSKVSKFALDEIEKLRDEVDSLKRQLSEVQNHEQRG